MPEVLITSITVYGTKKCIGGLVISTNQYLRLLKPGGYYQDANTPFCIGDIWEIGYSIAPNLRSPHDEDVYITSQNKISTVSNIKSFILSKGINIWKGDINNIFDGKIRWTGNGSGYISERIGLPSNSVGFWINDEDLNFDEKHYVYSNGKKLTYKGFTTPLQIIPSGTLIRLSLAKWWQPDDIEIEERCYLQLSGWY